VAEPPRKATHRRPTRRRITWVVLSGAALLAVAVGGGLALVLPARQPLLDGRDAMIAGRDRLLVGDAAGAGRSFARAEAAFRDAGDRLGNPLTTLASFVPIAGRTPDAVTAGAEAGVLIARAGRVVAGAAGDLPGGVGTLAPRDGVIPIDPFRRLAGPLTEARDLVAVAGRIVAEAPRRLVPGPVADAVEQLDRATGQALRALGAGAAMSRALPAFLGEDGPRRYLVAAQNPAELRGTGGIVGSYAILSVEDGRLDLGPFLDVGTLPVPNLASIELPTPEYGRIYGDYLERGAWSNANMTPDVPTAATVLERLYRGATGSSVDGAILADPHALARLMQVSGPQSVPGTDLSIDAGTLVPFATNEAYSLLTDSADRKRVLGAVAAAVLRRFLGSGASADPVGAGQALIEAAADGHLVLHATDPQVQARFEAAGVAASLSAPRGDFLSVVVNNAGANKIDFYAHRTVRYEATLLPGGSATTTARVTVDNEAPSEGQPAYVIGPYHFLRGDAQPGENLMLVSTYCAPGCRLDRFLENGRAEGVAPGEELGYPFFLSGLRIPSGGRADLEYGWRVPRAWEGDEYGGTYRLTVRGQPTINPTRLEVEVRIPPGMRVVGTAPGMRVAGDRVTWTGTAGDVSTFEVEFSRKLFGIL
jgi:hypothetical protein